MRSFTNMSLQELLQYSDQVNSLENVECRALLKELFSQLQKLDGKEEERTRKLVSRIQSLESHLDGAYEDLALINDTSILIK